MKDLFKEEWKRYEIDKEKYFIRSEEEMEKRKYSEELYKWIEKNFNDIEKFAIYLYCKREFSSRISVNFDEDRKSCYITSSWISNLIEYKKNKKQNIKDLLHNEDIWKESKYYQYYDFAKKIFKYVNDYKTAVCIHELYR